MNDATVRQVAAWVQEIESTPGLLAFMETLGAVDTTKIVKGVDGWMVFLYRQGELIGQYVATEA